MTERIGGRDRGVLLGAGGGQPEPERSFFGHHHFVEFFAIGQFLDVAAFGNQIAGIGKNVFLVLGEPSRAQLAAFFFVAGGHEDDVAVEQDAGALDRQHRHQVDHARTFIVQRAAAPNVTVLHLAGERRHLPFGRDGRDHIHMS